jgi:hypothetical protein
MLKLGMDMSVIAFAVMAVITIVLAAIMLFIEMNSKPDESRKARSQPAQDHSHQTPIIENHFIKRD